MTRKTKDQLSYAAAGAGIAVGVAGIALSSFALTAIASSALVCIFWLSAD